MVATYSATWGKYIVGKTEEFLSPWPGACRTCRCPEAGPCSTSPSASSQSWKSSGKCLIFYRIVNSVKCTSFKSLVKCRREVRRFYKALQIWEISEVRDLSVLEIPQNNLASSAINWVVIKGICKGSKCWKTIYYSVPPIVPLAWVDIIYSVVTKWIIPS